MFAVCLPRVRRMSADHPPYIRRMSAVYPPYLIAHFSHDPSIFWSEPPRSNINIIRSIYDPEIYLPRDVRLKSLGVSQFLGYSIIYINILIYA